MQHALYTVMSNFFELDKLL